VWRVPYLSSSGVALITGVITYYLHHEPRPMPGFSVLMDFDLHGSTYITLGSLERRFGWVL